MFTIHTSTIRSLLLRECHHFLTQAEGELLIAHVITKPRSFVIAHPEYALTKRHVRVFNARAQRRRNGEPLAYLTNHKEFYGLDFYVNENVLVPRPESELLVDLTIKRFALHVVAEPPSGNECIIDIGTGSGNLIIAIAKYLQNHESKTMSPPTNKTNRRLFAIDISKKALTVAHKNAKLHTVEKYIKFSRGNLLSPFKKILLTTNYSLQTTIVANLPYVDEKQKDLLLKKQESRGLCFEPQKALWSEKNGLRHYEKLITQTHSLFGSFVSKKKRYCHSFYEIDPSQKEQLTKIIMEHFPTAKIAFHKDLADKWRVCEWSI